MSAASLPQTRSCSRRRTLIARKRRGLGRLQDLLFVFLMRNATRAADYFRIPPTRVVELGAQVSL
jgi:KUP system potassium uptake protein